MNYGPKLTIIQRHHRTIQNLKRRKRKGLDCTLWKFCRIMLWRSESWLKVWTSTSGGVIVAAMRSRHQVCQACSRLHQKLNLQIKIFLLNESGEHFHNVGGGMGFGSGHHSHGHPHGHYRLTHHLAQFRGRPIAAECWIAAEPTTVRHRPKGNAILSTCSSHMYSTFTSSIAGRFNPNFISTPQMMS